MLSSHTSPTGYIGDPNSVSEAVQEHPRPDAPHEPQEYLSDLPLVHRTHYKSGYRDGISQGRQSAVQSGFDEGYELAARLALRIGAVLGSLEGLLEARDCGVREREELKGLLDRAGAELDVEEILNTIGNSGQVVDHGEEALLVGAEDLRRGLEQLEQPARRWEKVVAEKLERLHQGGTVT